MKVIPISEASPYNPPLHHAMVALKLCDAALCEAKQFWCGLSHFLPGGGAEWAYDDSPTEKLYVVLEEPSPSVPKRKRVLSAKGKPFSSRRLRGVKWLTTPIIRPVCWSSPAIRNL